MAGARKAGWIGIVLLAVVVGLLAFLLVKRAVAGGRRIPRPMPGLSLSLFLTGILALVLIMLWSPINSALQSSSIGVGVVFVLMLVVGAVSMFMGMRSNSRAVS